MTGRGRPGKAKSPDTECAKSTTRTEEMNRVAKLRCTAKGFTEERQNSTTEEQKPKEKKKLNHTDAKPSAQSTQAQTKQPRTPIGNTKAPPKGKQVKTCAGRAETQQSPEGAEKTKPGTPKETTEDSVKTTTAKARGGKSKSPKLAEETKVTQQEAPKGAKKALMKTTKAKTEVDVVPQDRREDKAAVDHSILFKTLEKLKIKRNERADAAEVINTMIKHIVMHLKKNTQCFKEVEEPLCTGSYYENLKISNPDEFDVMIPIPVDRVTITPFGDDGAFYSVGLKRGKSPLQKFEEAGTLSGSEMLKEFRVEVKKCVEQFSEWKLEKKKRGCPAVTLMTNVQSIPISLDVVLSLLVKSAWPPFTKEGLQIQGWLGAKVKQEFKRKPYYLVPKYEGSGTVENDGVLAKALVGAFSHFINEDKKKKGSFNFPCSVNVWRVSFSHIEKTILKNHGSQKTCCEREGERCCRKDCLKLLKHLLTLLKAKDSSLDKFCSYYAKTTLLHACCSRTKDSEWMASSLSFCFKLLLKDFVAHLEGGVLHNFFIPTQNLLSGTDKRSRTKLACCIEAEFENGFPIFK